LTRGDRVENLLPSNTPRARGNYLDRMRFRHLSVPALALAGCLLFSREARAGGEIQFRAAAGGMGSSWLHDGQPVLSIQLGYRFVDLVAPYFLARIGYGNTNERVIEQIQLGVQLWARIGMARPYARFGVLHQHEEPWASVQADGLGALLGVGDGIRHRAGLEGALGVDLPFKQYKSFQFHATLEGIFTGIPDDKGPGIYAGGTIGLGFNYAL
jgi:hypothetical protein